MKKNRGNAVVVIIVILALALLGWWLLRDRVESPKVVPNPNATTTNGIGNNTTTTTIDNLPVVGTQATADEIVVESPRLGDRISSPLTLRGRARGPWYFEASAPVTVVDANGKVLGQSYVMTTDEWMTTEFVPFEGTVSFETPTTDAGAIIFNNDNPSGDPTRSKYWVVPVLFR